MRHLEDCSLVFRNKQEFDRAQVLFSGAADTWEHEKWCIPLQEQGIQWSSHLQYLAVYFFSVEELVSWQDSFAGLASFRQAGVPTVKLFNTAI